MAESDFNQANGVLMGIRSHLNDLESTKCRDALEQAMCRF